MHAHDDDCNPRTCQLCGSDDIASEPELHRPFITERTCRNCGHLWKILS